MDPWSPIAGISLERYAELSAELGNEKDPAKQTEIVVALGVPAADWQAASSGWLARMQDPSLMGQVATRYMPLYQAALAKKSGGAPQVTFDDYVAMSGCVPVMGMAAMLAHYKLTETQWTMIAGHWNGLIPTNPAYMQFGLLVEQEAARIRAGGQPKPLGAPAPQSPGIAPPPPNPYGYQQQPYAQPNPYNNPNYQAHQAGQAVGAAFNQMGSALNSFFDSAVGAFSPGARVIVTWSDGNRYPATVTQPPRAGQLEVAFPDGRRIWVPQHAVMANY